MDRRVKAILEDSAQQLAVQAETWNKTEKDMLEREEVMRNAMVELNAKLMAAETLLTRIPAEK